MKPVRLSTGVSLGLSVWANESKDGKGYFYTLKKTFKKEGSSEYEETPFLNKTDFAALALLAPRVIEWEDTQWEAKKSIKDATSGPAKEKTDDQDNIRF